MSPGLALAGVALVSSGCGDDASVLTHPDGAGPCEVRIDEWPREDATHVEVGAEIRWGSNPPSSGQHYPVWAKWAKAYPSAVDRGYYVHNLEHGGVVLLYRCPAGCAEVPVALEAIGRELADGSCSGDVNARWLASPDPLLEPAVQVAAAAWGFTYRAACLDEASLRAFAAAHYAHGPEDTCADGLDVQP